MGRLIWKCHRLALRGSASCPASNGLLHCGRFWWIPSINEAFGLLNQWNIIQLSFAIFRKLNYYISSCSFLANYTFLKIDKNQSIPNHCHYFWIIVIPSELLTFLLNYCHFFKISIIPSKLVSFLTNKWPSKLLSLRFSTSAIELQFLSLLKAEKIGCQRWPYFRVPHNFLKNIGNSDHSGSHEAASYAYSLQAKLLNHRCLHSAVHLNKRHYSHTAKRILERLGIQTSSPFVKIW